MGDAKSRVVFHLLGIFRNDMTSHPPVFRCDVITSFMSLYQLHSVKKERWIKVASNTTAGYVIMYVQHGVMMFKNVI